MIGHIRFDQAIQSDYWLILIKKIDVFGGFHCSICDIWQYLQNVPVILIAARCTTLILLDGVQLLLSLLPIVILIVANFIQKLLNILLHMKLSHC